MRILEGQAILVTGASGGLGEAVTRGFLDAGAKVAGVARKVQPGSHRRFTAVQADLSEPGEAQRAVGETIDHFGRLDGVVHLMGGFAGGTRAEETPREMFESMLALNFHSAVAVFGAALPTLRASGRGRLIAVGSRAAEHPVSGVAAYAASKAALASLIRSIAAENKRSGITANLIQPATIDTPSNRASMPDADFATWTQPAHIAELMVWLCSDAAAHINGVVLPFNG
ncbi:MAG: SDR family NAD(P)-dependent oxidoreductase [Bryobacterales bacterium]|nr:SDR family NAD(P)-dependent oxidoreductase [Bryobacterales bacterium]